ncbi:hypothetical protein [Pseudoduganella chitinolytica]|uniref:Uncharacterized protein n=1 Tax=Pseudoduganella chitinolytica TaxID=34070 RepID=A0ABY8BEW4_9BURK|nr:hypothetical protein [Pseudoduganella chitinolytica]WEF33262.1 hypothetical protein PX653_00260 [Pseudoduganella chitinolytica]
MTTITRNTCDRTTVTPADDNRADVPDDDTERLIDRAFRIAAAVLLLAPALLAILLAHGPVATAAVAMA